MISPSERDGGDVSVYVDESVMCLLLPSLGLGIGEGGGSVTSQLAIYPFTNPLKPGPLGGTPLTDT